MKRGRAKTAAAGSGADGRAAEDPEAAGRGADDDSSWSFFAARSLTNVLGPPEVSVRAHIFQHVPFEGPGSIAPWLEARGISIGVTRLFHDAALPDPADVDLLIVMGGPMSVNDEHAFPWLVSEKRFIRDMISRGAPVLGICLGAQMIANVLGAKVYPNPEKEIGWFPIQSTPNIGPHHVFRFPDECGVFHWHGETFDLPQGAARLARSEACANQAFQFNGNVIGLQFHLETTPASARELVANCRDELVPGKYVQSEATILGAPPARYATINALMGRVLAFLLPDHSSGRPRTKNEASA
jgi:GMP synthase-like glutamine amidotransferase